MHAVSFQRLGLCTAPDSVKVKEDCLLSFFELEKIEKTINTLEDVNSVDLSVINEQVANIACVYNENVRHINSKACPKFQFPTEEEFNSTQYKRSEKSYKDAETIEFHQHTERLNEYFQLKQTSLVCGPLGEKIQSVIQRLKDIQPHAELPSKLEKPNAVNGMEVPFFCELRLRKVIRLEDAKLPKPSKEIVPAKAEKKEEILPVLPFTPHICVTAELDIAAGSTLGICYAPSWADKPHAFINSEKGWTGQIPVDTEWKFVIIDNAGKVLKWETGLDRKHDKNNEPLVISKNQVSFPSI